MRKIWNFIKYSIFAVIIGWVSFIGYEYHRGGFFNMPDIPEGAYTLSFKSGFRGIVFGVDPSTLSQTSASLPFASLTGSDPIRSYKGRPMDVPSWLEKEWSECSAPTEEERVGFPAMFTTKMHQDLRGARFDFVCRFEIDGETIYRGLIYSVPKL